MVRDVINVAKSHETHETWTHHWLTMKISTHDVKYFEVFYNTLFRNKYLW